MRRFLLMLVASAPLLSGQFQGLATTDDGAVLYFSTSLRLRGTDQFAWEKLFRADASGVRLYAQRERQAPADSVVTNQFRLTGASVSGDGSVVGVLTMADCLILGSRCLLSTAKHQTEIRGMPGRSNVTLPGQARLSRNGRYAVVCCDGTLIAPAALVDLQTGASRELPIPIYALPPISSAGVTILPQGESLAVVTMEGTRLVRTVGAPAQILVNDAGTAAYYVEFARSLVVRVDLATGTETPVYQGVNISLVGVSNAGDLVAFLSAAQLLVAAPDGSGLRLLTPESGGISEAVLAGGGKVAYAVSRTGRIFRIDVETAARTEVVGRTLTMQVPFPSSVPYPVAGSALCVSGTGFTPGPRNVGDLRILLDGTAVPLLDVSPDQVCVQVPWRTSQGQHTLTADAPADGPFEPAATGSIEVRGPSFPQFDRWLEGGASVALAWHEDFRALVTRERPAGAGEIVHLSMTGLGPVLPEVADGEPGPANPPARAVIQPECRASRFPGGAGQALEIVFAGIAPGTIGRYRVSIRLPAVVPVDAGETWITCSAGPPSTAQTAPLWAAPIPVHERLRRPRR